MLPHLHRRWLQLQDNFCRYISRKYRCHQEKKQQHISSRHFQKIKEVYMANGQRFYLNNMQKETTAIIQLQ